MGIGDATKTSLVQCNVGNKSPVLLCALLPNKTESCHLDLEFEEAVDVVFSVIGPRSVYLTGYYVNHSRHFNPHSDSYPFFCLNLFVFNVVFILFRFNVLSFSISGM